MSYQTSMACLLHPPRPSGQQNRDEIPRSVFLYILAMESESLQFSELPGKKNLADTAPHSAGNLYFKLALGRLNGMGYEDIK